MGSSASYAEAVTIYEELLAMTEANRGLDAQTALALVTLSEVSPRPDYPPISYTGIGGERERVDCHPVAR